ncbi:MAG: hypothetical protein OXC01_20010 [Immundisolibacterales bacterium]|nr:hypothetical protein [Immundisolibacterales bacterium]
MTMSTNPESDKDHGEVGAATSAGWEPELEELRRRQRFVAEMGGPEKVARHHGQGKLTVRERVDGLLDPGTFHEIGSVTGVATYDEDGGLTGLRPANFIYGRGDLDGRRVVVEGDDFTVRGGAADASIWDKMVAAEQMARELRLPLVRLVDGTGGGGSVKTIETEGRTYVSQAIGWQHAVANLATVPVIGLGLGSIAGLGSARLVTSHYSVLVRGTSQVFVAGPPVVARIGETVDKEELGRADMHAGIGAVDAVVDSEADAFAHARRFLSYLPQSVHELPPRGPVDDDPARREDWLIRAIPRDRRKVYRMRPIIEAVVDRGSFFEIGKAWGRSLITGFARLDGWPVAVVAADPYFYGGAWTADASLKMTRFAELAETFHLPVVHLVDIPGFLIGTQAERSGTIRHGARALASVFQTTVPWCSIIVRKCFGVAGAAHMNTDRLRYRYAWPSADWGSLPVEGGIEAAYKADLEAAEDREAALKDIEERLELARSPFRTAETYWVEEIIDPRDTRRLLCEFANLAAPLRESGPSRFTYRP